MAASVIHRILVGGLQYVPRPIVWRFSQRYIAGTRVQDAYKTVRDLNATGCTATIDVLGEDSTDKDQVDAACDLYLKALDDIQSESLDCGISVKLSEMGLRFDVDYCKQVMRTLLDHAANRGNFVRIDMEDSSVTSITLDIYRELRSDFDNVGIVIQSCLRRSDQDIAELMEAGHTDVRLCKGIYIEPEEISFRDADDIRISFQNLLEQMFRDSTAHVGIATHDLVLVAHAEEFIHEMGIPKDRYEFQMLLGVAGTLRRSLVAKGHPLRVYVPFGKLWYNYSMRRLRENPNIVGHIVKNLFSRH